MQNIPREFLDSTSHRDFVADKRDVDVQFIFLLRDLNQRNTLDSMRPDDSFLNIKRDQSYFKLYLKTSSLNTNQFLLYLVKITIIK